MKLMDLICEMLNEGKGVDEPKWEAVGCDPVRVCDNGAYKDIKTGRFVSDSGRKYEKEAKQ